MTKFLNFTELYIETHNQYIKKHKNNNGNIKKHIVQKRYNAFTEFSRSQVYW